MRFPWFPLLVVTLTACTAAPGEGGSSSSGGASSSSRMVTRPSSSLAAPSSTQPGTSGLASSMGSGSTASSVMGSTSSASTGTSRASSVGSGTSSAQAQSSSRPPASSATSMASVGSSSSANAATSQDTAATSQDTASTSMGATSATSMAGQTSSSTAVGPQCGNNQCEAGETCGSCGQDCGTCCGNGVCDAAEDCGSCAQDCNRSGGQACQRVGMFILGWHAPAVAAVKAIQASGGTPITVEGVLRSNGAHQLKDVLPTPELFGLAGAFHFQAQPENGFTCFYRKRSTEAAGSYPDCDNIPAVMERHARLLTDAGVDFVVLDGTNLVTRDAFSDAIQLRPFEVLAEEWSSLRARGIKTPDIAIWAAVPSSATLWADYLAVYNTPAFDRLIMRDRSTGKKVFFVVDPPDMPRWPDPGVVASIVSNGGRNDVMTLPMWAFADHVGPDLETRGVWNFLAACREDGVGAFTTTLSDAPCNQPWTPNSALGSSVTVSPSYQLNFASVPFGAVGQAGGLTFRKQFETAFSVQPDILFISSWNEHVAQPGMMEPSTLRSMGLEEDPAAGSTGFVDTYGINYGRDIEPTVEGGSSTYDLMRSCLRVYRSGATSCSNAAEPCCQGGNTSSSHVNAYAVMIGDNTDANTGHVVVTSRVEMDALTTQGWRQVCAHSPVQSAFCANPAELDNAGPFILFAQDGVDRAPLYRCDLGARHYFMTGDANCEGQGSTGVRLGFVSTVKRGETLRPLWRCYSSVFQHSHTFSGTCTAGNREGLLGYVR